MNRRICPICNGNMYKAGKVRYIRIDEKIWGGGRRL